MMMAETFNNLWGRTVSSLFLTWVPIGGANCRQIRIIDYYHPGGSSGGESALLALRGSFIGVGTDIGGSIRIPAAFTNLYSLRPTFGRFPTYGMHICTCRSRSYQLCQRFPPSTTVLMVGPLGHSPRDLKLYSKTIVDTKPWLLDPKAIPLPWRPIELPSQLSFAIIKSNNIVNPLPPISRALTITIEKLKQAGHEIIEWRLNDQTEVGILTVHPLDP